MEDVLEFKRTLCLLQVIETGTLRAAADQLNTDPSAISRAIARLESDTGLTLLERRGRGVVPTDAGRLVALFARRQQDLNESFQAEVNNLKSATRGHVELALGEGFVDMLLEPVLLSFVREHPDITYSIHVAGTNETVRCIVQERAQIALAFQPPNDVRLRSHYSRAAPMRVHVHKGHPLAHTRRALRLSDLAPYGWAAMDESFGVRQHIQAAELDENVKLKPALLTNSFKILWEFASQGLGYVVNPLSMPLKGAQFRQMVSLPLANPILNNSRTHVISLAGRHLPPATASMLRHILKTFPALEARRV